MHTKINIVYQMRIQEIVKSYFDERGLTLRKFAEELSENIQNDLSHATIINWRDGNSTPDTDLMISIAAAYTDWRLDFALDLLNVKHPTLLV